MRVTKNMTAWAECMIIEAVVQIELKADGTWKIRDLKTVSDTKLPEEQRQKPTSGVVSEHFANRDRIRKKRAREKFRKPHHCSECGLEHRNKVTHPAHMIELADYYGPNSGGG